jgi:hypothetical protein
MLTTKWTLSPTLLSLPTFDISYHEKYQNMPSGFNANICGVLIISKNTLSKEGWYERRILWLAELVSVMGILLLKMKQAMEGIHVKETRLEKIDAKAIIDHF